MDTSNIIAQLRSQFEARFHEGKKFYDDYKEEDHVKKSEHPKGAFVGFYICKGTKTKFCAKRFPPQVSLEKATNEVIINDKLHRSQGGEEFFIGIRDIYCEPDDNDYTFSVVYSNRPLREDLLLANEKIIDEAMAAKLFEKVCRGLEILHKGIDGTSYVHCDIKPQNLLKSASNKVYIIDFGAVNTSTGCTKKYASPEQHGNLQKHEDDNKCPFEPISQSSDYWSLGISIAEKILGQEAIRFDSRFGLTSKFFKHPDIKKASDQLVNLLCKLLEYDKDKRMFNTFSIKSNKSKIVDDAWFKQHDEKKEDRDDKIPVYSVWRRVGGKEHRMASRVLWATQIEELEKKVGREIRQKGLSFDLHVVDNAWEAYERIAAPDKVTNKHLTEQKINCLDTINCLLVFYSHD